MNTARTGALSGLLIAALSPVLGILAALRDRDATGQGQWVQVNVLVTLLSSLVNQGAAHTAAGCVPGLGEHTAELRDCLTVNSPSSTPSS